jgi:hypothetical protein
VDDRLQLSTFEPHVGDLFTVDLTGSEPITLTLAEANRGPWQPPEGPDNAFELMFAGPADPVLPQATYRLTNASLGSLDIFIVPIARSDQATTYQAVFS